MTEGGKPEGSKIGWKLINTSTRFQNDILTLREDTVELPDGKTMQYAYAERAEAVIIVPLTHAGEIVLIRQYRYPVDAWSLEVPAGGSHDTGTASLDEVVRKELREEIGATCGDPEYVGFFHSCASLTDEKCNVYLAPDVELKERVDQEAAEEIQIVTIPAAEALCRARSGEMKTAQCTLALLWCEEALRRRGALNPG